MGFGGERKFLSYKTGIKEGGRMCPVLRVKMIKVNFNITGIRCYRAFGVFFYVWSAC